LRSFVGEPSDLSEHLPDSARAGQEIAGLEDMLNPNQDLPQIDDDALKFFLKNGIFRNICFVFKYQYFKLLLRIY